MNLNVTQINRISALPFKKKTSLDDVQKESISLKNSGISVYGNDVIRTNPAQLSLFHMHDFHGQNIRMERAYSIIDQYNRNQLTNQNDMFSKDMPVDKLKFCSGDMFLGENLHELEAVNAFLNLAGILANTVGNHECDTEISDFVKKVKSHNYKFLGANMHPDSDNPVGEILSKSFIARVNGNQYGVIGLVPTDMASHMKRPEEVLLFNISDKSDTIKDLQGEIDKIKAQGVNKIILLSHLGLENEQYIAQNVSDIDVILGGHTHNLLTQIKEGENLFKSPKGEPVLIMQVGRDGEYVGIPNIKFNELGQMTDLQYNVIKTDDFARNMIAKHSFEEILGKPEIVGSADKVEEPPKDIYANENPHCDFILDCLRSELDTDIAVMNSANIRGRFYKGPIDTRDLMQISPFANNVVVIRATEKEIVDGISGLVASSMKSQVHRPGILQVSGLKYEYSKANGKLTALAFVDKNGNEHEIDINSPDKNKFYTVAVDDYCAKSEKSGINLAHRLDNAIRRYHVDKDAFVAEYLRSHPEPITIKVDGRIKSSD